MNQLDDQFGHPISGCGLAAEDHGPRRHLRRAGPFEPVIHGDQVEHIQVLPLVLVQSLHLDVEERLRVDGDAGPLLDETGQRELVVGFHGTPLALKTAVGRQRLEPLEFVFETRYPSIADLTGDERAQLGLLRTIHRRGVTPLVTLKNFSGIT